MSGCDAVVHLAAETHVDRSLLDATPFVRTNVEGTVRLLAAAGELGVERFLHMSTDEVYGDIEAPRLAAEDDALAPRSPNAASKAGAELQCRAFAISYGLPVVIARGSNVYGENQYPEKLIPLFTSNALRGEALPVYGDGRQQRDWTYVGDLCEALLVLLERGEPGLAYNITAEDVHENLEVVQLLLDALGAERSLIRHVEDRRGHDRRYAMTAARMRALGWRPAAPLAPTLAATVRGYAEHQDWWQALREGDFADYYRLQYGRR
jgi:dTDP-glucose 4,6-dehydratase